METIIKKRVEHNQSDLSKVLDCLNNTTSEQVYKIIIYTLENSIHANFKGILSHDSGNIELDGVIKALENKSICNRFKEITDTMKQKGNANDIAFCFNIVEIKKYIAI